MKSSLRFGEILQPATNVLPVARSLPRELELALERIALAEPFEHTTRLDGGDPDPSPLLASVDDSMAHRFLTRDIAALARDYAATVDRKHVHARLSVVRSDACRKFHADYVTIRLLCTYAGLGTEWVANGDVARENLARRDVDVDEANRSVVRSESAIRRCTAGDIILLKGDAHPGNGGLGAVHRSPPIEARAQTRLVLKMDEHPCGC